MISCGCCAAILTSRFAARHGRIHQYVSAVEAWRPPGTVGLSCPPRQRWKDACRFRHHIGDLESRGRTHHRAGSCEEDRAGAAGAPTHAPDCGSADAAGKPPGVPWCGAATAWRPGARLGQERPPGPRSGWQTLYDPAAREAPDAGYAEAAANAGDAKSPASARNAASGSRRSAAWGTGPAESPWRSWSALIAAISRGASDAARADGGGNLDQHEDASANAHENGGALRPTNPGVSQCRSRRTAPSGLSDPPGLQGDDAGATEAGSPARALMESSAHGPHPAGATGP